MQVAQPICAWSFHRPPQTSHLESVRGCTRGLACGSPTRKSVLNPSMTGIFWAAGTNYGISALFAGQSRAKESDEAILSWHGLSCGRVVDQGLAAIGIAASTHCIRFPSFVWPALRLHPLLALRVNTFTLMLVIAGWIYIVRNWTLRGWQHLMWMASTWYLTFSYNRNVKAIKQTLNFQGIRCF